MSRLLIRANLPSTRPYGEQQIPVRVERVIDTMTNETVLGATVGAVLKDAEGTSLQTITLAESPAGVYVGAFEPEPTEGILDIEVTVTKGLAVGVIAQAML